MKLFKRKIDGEKRTIASNFLSLTVLQISDYILPLIILPFLVRVLGSEKFGLVMFAQSLATFLKIVVDFGFNISGTRAVSLARNNKVELSRIFSAIMIVKSVMIIIGFLILVFIVETFTRFNVDAIVYYLSFGIVIGHAVFPVWFFQGIEKMRFVTGVNILAKVIFALLLFLIVRQESDYVLVPAFNSLGFILAGLLGLLLSLRHVRFTWPGRDLIKNLVKDTSSLFVGKFASNLYTTCNVLILGLFAGNTIVGVYSSMEKLILAAKNFYSPLYQAIFPWLAKQPNPKRTKVIRQLFPIIFVVGLLISLLIIFLGENILDIIYDDELITSYSIIFKILALIAIFAGLNMLFNNLYFPAIKKYQTRMKIFIAGGLFNVVVSLILVQYYGIYGMAYTVVTTEFFLLVLGIVYFNKYKGLSNI